MLLAYTGAARALLTMAEKSAFIPMVKDINDMFQQVEQEKIELEMSTRLLYSVPGRQWLRLFAAYRIAAIKEIIHRRERDGLCQIIQYPYFDLIAEETIARWIPGRDILLSLLSMDGDFTKLDRYDKSWFLLYQPALYKAGTQTVMRAKVSKTENPDNNWPQIISNISESWKCYSWSYMIEPGGGSVIFEHIFPPSKKDVHTMIYENHMIASVPSNHLIYLGLVNE